MHSRSELSKTMALSWIFNLPEERTKTVSLDVVVTDTAGFELCQVAADETSATLPIQVDIAAGPNWLDVATLTD